MSLTILAVLVVLVADWPVAAVDAVREVAVQLDFIEQPVGLAQKAGIFLRQICQSIFDLRYSKVVHQEGKKNLFYNT